MKSLNFLPILFLLTSLYANADPTAYLPMGYGCEADGKGIIEKVEGSNFAAVGYPVRYKADLQIPAGIYVDVDFGTSEDGLVGEDNSGIDGNAYHYITFETILSRQVNNSLVWVDTEGFCAYKLITVHGAPIANISDSVTNDGSYISGVITGGGLIDELSKSGLSDSPIKYEFQAYKDHKWNGKRCEVIEEIAKWETVQSLSSDNTFNFSYRACPVRFRVRSYGGVFYSDWANSRMIL